VPRRLQEACFLPWTSIFANGNRKHSFAVLRCLKDICGLPLRGARFCGKKKDICGGQSKSVPRRLQQACFLSRTRTFANGNREHSFEALPVRRHLHMPSGRNEVEAFPFADQVADRLKKHLLVNRQREEKGKILQVFPCSGSQYTRLTCLEDLRRLSHPDKTS